MAVFLNANSSTASQEIVPTPEIIVVRLVQSTVASQNGIFDEQKSAFVAPQAGVYRCTVGTTVSGRNNVTDGGIFGFSVNGQPPSPTGNFPDLSTTNILVLRPGMFTQTPIAQTLSVLLKLSQGDTVQFALQGVQDALFNISWSYMAVTLVS